MRNIFFLTIRRSAYSRFTQKKEEFVEVPKDLKGYVIGKGGCTIKEILKSSGAIIRTQKDYEGFTVSGDAEQRACAKRLILKKVVRSVRLQRKM